MNLFPVRLKRLVLGILQSPRLVPVSSVLFVVIFVVTLIAGIENARAMRQRIKLDYLHQQSVLVRQAADRLRQELETVKAEVRSLYRLAIVGDRDNLELNLHEAYVRMHGLGVVEMGVIDPERGSLDLHEEGLSCATVDLLAVPKGTGQVQTRTLADPNHPQHITISTSAPVPEGGSGTSLPLTSFAHVDLYRLTRYLLREVQQTSGAEAWSVDIHGRYLFASDSSWIGKDVLKARKAGAEGGLPEAFAGLVQQELLAGSSGMTEMDGFSTTDAGSGTRHLFAWAPLTVKTPEETLVGAVVLETPAREVIHGLETLYLRQYLGEGGLLAGLLLFGVLVASYQQRLSRRLKTLVGEQDQILSGILTNSVDAVIVIDENDNIQMWNRGAQLIFGYAPEEMLGKPLEILIPPDLDAEEEIRWINEEIATKGYVRNYTTQRLTKGGRRIMVDISRTPFQAPDASFSGSTAVIKDISEKAELDQRMYNAEKLASIGLLASGVAHEINNPLAIVLGFTDLLKERFPEGSDNRKDLEMIEFNANQAQKIVQDLLNFSRVTERNEGSTDVIEGIRMVVDFVTHTRLTGEVRLEVDLPDTLPTVIGDRREFQQILLNLVNNSLAAVDREQGWIRITAAREGDKVVIRVVDNGCGIPADMQHRIFDPFFTTKDVGEGTGLGLSLCYGIVKKWGGEIDFESTTATEGEQERHGTTFTVYLPVEEEIR